ncbi:glycosyltransferase family 4 protein [Aestuariibaculum sp. TT11]|uniref:Glycosyltransferase family 4 protein n=2 Tax=Aestuariibaculum sediminum TaxID=2770637 RepID=A0A8J6QK67_9FLAO|nr:glycosyltransferase family 4 protein [Aestuariibaculum sediminum]
MVSIPSLHFFRWVEQLKEADVDVYWFDVTGMAASSERIQWVKQHTGWKLKWDYQGRTFLKKNAPKVYNYIQKYNERDVASVFEDYLKEIQPDVVHSFALYLSCAPILEVMQRHKHVKWIYSSWGSDLFYFQNQPDYLKDIKRVLPRIDYMFADCKRDFEIAENYGFKGEFLGVFPGGGGFDWNALAHYMLPFEERNIILIKGFQGRSGRAITVLKALKQLEEQLISYKIIVIGADAEVFEAVNQGSWSPCNNIQILGRIPHDRVLTLMGQALLYIGNSNSDGIPNTLLEAMGMGAFPIQSNPGGATSEIVIHDKNGLIINDCNDPQEIKSAILKAIDDRHLIHKAFNYNQRLKCNFDFNLIKTEVLNKYFSLVE